jgi:hypothetical protein
MNFFLINYQTRDEFDSLLKKRVTKYERGLRDCYVMLSSLR